MGYKNIFTILFILCCSFLKAQTGIGTTTPDASAKLDVTSSNKGFLPPRVALTATNAASPITSPANGLMVFNTTTGEIEINKGNGFGGALWKIKIRLSFGWSLYVLRLLLN